MEAKTPFDRVMACLLAGMFGGFTLWGFIYGLFRELGPQESFLRRIIVQEILFIFSAFFVCTFLYYMLGDRSWLRPYLKKYAFRAAILAFVLHGCTMVMWFIYTP